METADRVHRSLRPVARSRIGSWFGTVAGALVVVALLLAASDLWAAQTRAVGGVLDAAGLTHTVVAESGDYSAAELGRGSRDARVRPGHAPFIRLAAAEPARPSGTVAVTVLMAAIAAVAGAVFGRTWPLPLRGALVVTALGAAGVLVSLFVNPVPVVDPAVLVFDWRTSAVVPAVVVTVVFVLDMSAVPGSLLLKAAVLTVMLIVVAVYSTARLAVMASGLGGLGAWTYLPLSIGAGAFWDIVPGFVVLAYGHAVLRFGVVGRRRWLP